MDDATRVITQRRFLRGRQTLTLHGDLLKLEYRRGLSLQEYRFNLHGFLPDPVRIRRVPILRIVGLILLGLLGLFLIPFGIAAEATGMGTRMGGLSAMGLMLLITVGVVWVPTAREMINIVVFEGPGGRMILWPNLPNEDEFNTFLAAMISQISRLQNRESILLRQLHQAGIIDDWQYNQATELLQRNLDPMDK